MDQFTRIIRSGEEVGAVSGVVSLGYARREKTRQKIRLTSGESIGIRLPRGTIMRGGDYLQSDDNRVIAVVSASERVSTIHAQDPEVLARVAYHLGNRHVWVQVGNGWLRYLADHVLDEMVQGLGCKPESEIAPFEPEGGAYHAHHHTGQDI